MFEHSGDIACLSQLAEKFQRFRVHRLGRGIGAFIAGEIAQVGEGPRDASPVPKFSKHGECLLVKRASRRRVALFACHVPLVAERPGHAGAVALAPED